MDKSRNHFPSPIAPRPNSKKRMTEPDHLAIHAVGAFVDITERKKAEGGLRAEEQLLQSEKNFAYLVEKAPFGIFMLDSQFRISQLNATAHNGAFRNVRPVIGRDFAEAIRIIWPEPLATEVIAIFRRTLETGEPYRSSDFQNERHDVEGTESYEWELHQITLPDGQHAVICYYYDSTRVRQAEYSLRESEERLTLATEVAGLGVWHWYPDSDRACWENERMFEIYGRSREDGVLGAAEFEEQVLHPDDAEPFRRSLSNAVETGNHFFFQGRIFRKDGQLRWIEFSGQGEHRGSGSERRIVGTAADVTERKQAEDALRQQKERSEFVAEASDVGFWFCDLPFDKLIWDKRVKNHFWLRPEADVTIQTFYEQIHPEDREPTRHAIEESIAGNRLYETEYRTVAPDGRYKWICAIGRTSYDKAGNPTRFDGVTMDITERKQAEDALKQSEEQFKVLAVSLPELCWIADSDGHIFWYNPRWYEYTGTTPEQMEGWGWQSVHDPDMLPSVLKQWKASLETGQPFEMEFPLRGADGVLRWFLTRINPVRDSEGKIIRWIGTNTNINQQRELRRSLVEARDELENRVQERTADLEKKTIELLQKGTMLDLANDAVLVRDADNRLTYWNKGAERLYGWTSGEALGKSAPELFRTEFPVPLSDIRQMDRWEGELRQHKRDGSSITVASRWTTLRDKNGKPVAWLQINSDITARKRAEEAARRLSGRILSLQDAERRRIARGLHDSLGQYLSALKMSLAVLSTTDNKEAAVVAECSDIVDICLTETRTISYLLHPPLLDEAGFHSAAQWYVDGFSRRSGIKVNLELPPELSRLHRDAETALFRVVQEALTNVHRHSGASIVDIRLGVDTEQVRLEVSDNGRGIPKDRLQQVFESGAGTGVGLAGMRERVREAGGSLDIESNQSGTLLRVAIPIAESRKNWRPEDSNTPGVPAA